MSKFYENGNVSINWVPFALILTLFQLFLVSFFTRDIQHQLQRELSHPELCMYITDKEVVGFLSGSRRDARPQKRKMKSTVLSAFPLRRDQGSSSNSLVILLYVWVRQTTWLQSILTSEQFSSNCLNIILSFNSLEAPGFPREV